MHVSLTPPLKGVGPVYLEDWGVTSSLLSSVSSSASTLDSLLSGLTKALNSSYWLLRTQNAATVPGSDPR